MSKRFRIAHTVRCALGLVTFFGASAFADIIRVPGDQPTIQAGIDAAVDGDVVLIADGVYTGSGNKNLDFAGKAITVRGENGRDNCIIDCEGDGRAFYFHSGEGADSVVEGLTIRNGRVQEGSPGSPGGGGILCIGSSPAITGCTFSQCNANDPLADAVGGGIYCDQGSDLIIRGCAFRDNRAFCGGGGVAIRESSPTIIGSQFSDNAGSKACGGSSGVACFGGSPKIIDCSFIDGRETALSSEGAGTPLIRGCLFVGNSSVGAGAIATRSRTTIERCRFVFNSAFTGAGAISCSATTEVVDCEFRGNWATMLGPGALSIVPGTIVRNCTFVGNSAGISSRGGAISGDSGADAIVNCIFWGNIPDQVAPVWRGQVLVSYSVVQDGWPGEGNIDLDPRFVDLANGDLHLLSDSPAIDAGSNALVPRNLPFDLDGLCRIMDGDLDDLHVVDMGAYEFAGVTGDCNANGVCDWIDITNGSEDCNRNAVPDECESAKDRDGDGLKDICDNCPDHFNPDQADCDGDGTGDVCAIASGLSEDCNGNGIPDECDIASGFSVDCNGNGVPDACDIASGASPDCNENGIPDECDIRRQFVAESAALSPFWSSRPQDYFIDRPPPAGYPVRIQIEARSDLENTNEFVDVMLNGTPIGTVFVNNGRDCSASLDEFSISAAQFNEAVAGGHASIALIASRRVFDCRDSFVRVTVSYETGESEDCNANGVPDECETDRNGNGVPDVCEAPPGDLNCDLSVNAFDIEPFILAVFDPGTYLKRYPDCDIDLGDINRDGSVNSFDIEPFLDLLFGP